jgi:hypothetical protein
MSGNANGLPAVRIDVVFISHAPFKPQIKRLTMGNGITPYWRPAPAPARWPGHLFKSRCC